MLFALLLLMEDGPGALISAISASTSSTSSPCPASRFPALCRCRDAPALEEPPLTLPLRIVRCCDEPPEERLVVLLPRRCCVGRVDRCEADAPLAAVSLRVRLGPPGGEPGGRERFERNEGEGGGEEKYVLVLLVLFGGRGEVAARRRRRAGELGGLLLLAIVRELDIPDPAPVRISWSSPNVPSPRPTVGLRGEAGASKLSLPAAAARLRLTLLLETERSVGGREDALAPPSPVKVAVELEADVEVEADSELG